MKKKVAIIGSGIGGLCTGLRLLKDGFEVDIYEKQPYPGGVTASYQKDGFRFDTTASIALDPMSYDTVFKDCGLNPRNYFNYQPLDTLYHVFFEDGRVWQLKRNANTQKEAFADFFGEPYRNYATFINRLYQRYLLADEFFLTQSFSDIKSVINKQTLVAALKLKPFQSAYNEISSYINNQNLRDFLAFLSFYMGVSPYQLINTYAAVPALTQVRGLKHITGGMSQYVNALVSAFSDLGGHLFCNMPVDEIAIQNDKACGIWVENQLLPYDIVVSNADYCYTISNLIQNKVLSKRYNPRVNDSVAMSCSVFMLRLGLKTKLSNLGVHNVYISNEFKAEMERIVNGLLPENPPIYVYYPSCIDESFVKGDNVTLNMMVRVPNLKDSNFLWDERTVEAMKKLLKSKLVAIAKIENLDAQIVFEDVLTPIDLQEHYNCHFGAAFGLAHTTSQSIVLRPQVANSEVANLYFVGSSIHPGNGVTMVMKCAKIAAEEIAKSPNES